MSPFFPPPQITSLTLIVLVTFFFSSSSHLTTLVVVLSAPCPPSLLVPQLASGAETGGAPEKTADSKESKAGAEEKTGDERDTGESPFKRADSSVNPKDSHLDPAELSSSQSSPKSECFRTETSLSAEVY